MQTIPWRLSRWKRNQRLTSFIHLPFRSSEQIGSSPASESVTFQTGEPEGAFCSASEDEASRLVLVGLSPSSIQRDTQITQPPPPTPFPDSTVKRERTQRTPLGEVFHGCNLQSSHLFRSGNFGHHIFRNLLMPLTRTLTRTQIRSQTNLGRGFQISFKFD